jgi:hypothetical protein
MKAWQRIEVECRLSHYRKQKMKRSAWLLVILSVVSGILWRAEIELRWGWNSLAWISGFHYSALLICLLFSAWLYFFTTCCKPEYALVRSVLAFGGGIVSYFLWEFTFTVCTFRFGVSLPFALICLLLVFVVIPLSISLLARSFHPRFSKLKWILPPFLFTLSFPLSFLFLWVTNNPDGPDPIIAVKSGFIFVGFIIAAGFPFIGDGDSKQAGAGQQVAG